MKNSTYKYTSTFKYRDYKVGKCNVCKEQQLLMNTVFTNIETQEKIEDVCECCAYNLRLEKVHHEM